MQGELLWLATDDHPRELMELIEERLHEGIVQRKWRLAMSAFAQLAAATAGFSEAERLLDVLDSCIDRGDAMAGVDRILDEFMSDRSMWKPQSSTTPIEFAKCSVQTAIGAARANPNQLFDAMYAQLLECPADEFETVTIAQAAIFKDIFGNPFRPVAFDPVWRSESAVALARAAYESRNFTLLPILADAFEEAGCDHPDVLAHCRGPGPHVRDCWVVDLVLGKS